ncbi:MAG: DNA mismatch endonuclease Vsr [Planctomycetes bacterium]|nr:DNA mismatch endonuclease Vsr [Planctomycetota bacterium]
MVDFLTKEQRSFNMSHIRNKNTRPEIFVRSIVHRMGYRYTLHRKDLPGNPDMVLARHHKIIFVHGCFWHMHKCRYGKVKPATNAKFWQTKREGNVDRDKRNLRKLRKNRWKVLIVWECQTRHIEKLTENLHKFLTS